MCMCIVCYVSISLVFMRMTGCYSFGYGCLLIFLCLSCTERVVHRVKDWKSQQTAAPTAAQTSDVLSRTVSAFSALRADKDLSLVRLIALEFKDADVPVTVASASASLQSPKHLIFIGEIRL